MRRTRFIVGIGAFAAVGARLTHDALSQAAQPLALGNQGALYQYTYKGAGNAVDCIAAVLPQSAFQARILSNRLRPDDIASVVDLSEETNAVVGINGGFFSGIDDPDGLLILDGKKIGSARADWKGWFWTGVDGAATVGDTSPPPSARYAMQGYPMLIEPGGVMGMRKDDRVQARRSIIAQGGSSIVAMVTSQTSLYFLASILMEKAGDFGVSGIDAAINLSGDATTSFYAKTPQGKQVIVQSQLPSRDVIAFYGR